MMRSTTQNTSITLRGALPRYLPMRAGRSAPLLRMESIPLKKSWVAPAKMQPRMIQRYAAGPNLAPMMAPKIGPVPAMLRNWIMKIFQFGIGT